MIAASLFLIRILEIDLRGWKGAAGQAALAVTQRWEYLLQQAHSGSVIVIARDLPGQGTQESASKKLPG